MKTYEVTITETLETTVKIKASSRAETEALVESRWPNERLSSAGLLER